MTLIIDLDPGQEALLLQEAERQGLDANEIDDFQRYADITVVHPQAVPELDDDNES